MRKLLVVLAIAAVLGSVGVFALRAGNEPVSPGTRPTIVLILSDDQRWDTIGQMETVQKELVAKGVTFSNGFVVTPLCCPSRVSILTGQYAHTTGVWLNRGPLGGFPAFHGDGSTIATWLRGAGYHTGLFGKYLNAYEETTYIPPGWERWVALDGGASNFDFYYNYDLNVDGDVARFGSLAKDYSTDVVASEAVDFIRDTSGSLLVYFSPYAPHSPVTPAKRDQGVPVDAERVLPPSYDEPDVADKPVWVRERPPLDDELNEMLAAKPELTARTMRSVDRAIAEILDALEETGRLHNSLIVYMSDNGLLWGEHRLADKIAPYEESIRVPFVVRFDREVAGPRIDPRLVLNIDLAPTFASVAGVPAPGAEGKSLTPLLASPDGSWREDFLFESERLFGVPSYCGVRSERYKYVVYETGEEELYDLKADPYELENAGRDSSRADVLAQLRARVHELCTKPPPGFTAPP